MEDLCGKNALRDWTSPLDEVFLVPQRLLETAALSFYICSARCCRLPNPVDTLSQQELYESSMRSVRHVFSGRYKANKLSVDHAHQRQKQQDQSKLRANCWHNWESPAFQVLDTSWIIRKVWKVWIKHIFVILSYWWQWEKLWNWFFFFKEALAKLYICSLFWSEM